MFTCVGGARLTGGNWKVRERVSERSEGESECREGKERASVSESVSEER